VVLSEPRVIDGVTDYISFTGDIRKVVTTNEPLSVTGPQIEALRDAVLNLARDVEPETKPERLFGHVAWIDRDQVPRPETLPRVDTASLRRMRPLDAIGHVAWTQFSCQSYAIDRETYQARQCLAEAETSVDTQNRPLVDTAKPAIN
jgi:hypothetical protein